MSFVPRSRGTLADAWRAASLPDRVTWRLRATSAVRDPSWRVEALLHLLPATRISGAHEAEARAELRASLAPLVRVRAPIARIAETLLDPDAPPRLWVGAAVLVHPRARSLAACPEVVAALAGGRLDHARTLGRCAISRRLGAQGWTPIRGQPVLIAAPEVAHALPASAAWLEATVDAWLRDPDGFDREGVVDRAVQLADLGSRVRRLVLGGAEDPERALVQLGAIRERSGRDAGRLWLVRLAAKRGDPDLARAAARAMEGAGSRFRAAAICAVRLPEAGLALPEEVPPALLPWRRAAAAALALRRGDLGPVRLASGLDALRPGPDRDDTADLWAAVRLAAFLGTGRNTPGTSADIRRAAVRPEVLALVEALDGSPVSDRALEVLVAAGPPTCADALRARVAILFAGSVGIGTPPISSLCSPRSAGRALRVGPPGAALAVLVGAGGERAARLLADVAVRHPRPAVVRADLLGALAWIDPGRARRIAGQVLERAALDGDADGDAVWRLAESAGWADPGAAERWARVRAARVRQRGPVRTRRFLAELVQRAGRLPGRLVLDAALGASSAAEAVAVALARERALVESPFATLRDATPLDALAASLAPERLAGTSPPWSVETWSRVLNRARRFRWHDPSDEVLARFPPDTADRLRVGRAPPGVAVLQPLPVQDLQLRYLQSGPDLRTFLRFADCVPCCWRHPPSGAGRPLRNLLRIWRDPTAFCFQIEHARTGEPTGFVFGWLAPMVDGTISVALNGVYLRHPRLDARDAVLRAIEHGLCRPLGLRTVVVANLYGGRGPLPARYVPVTSRAGALAHRDRLIGDLRSACVGPSDDELCWTRVADGPQSSPAIAP